ncbi:hypothetical protein NLX78_13200 [Paenibacillus sp. Lou8.1]|uniref:hypothetical protein n=1 Tax=Paenibacillus sp. Lou8.1 TaxID=2962041 RepID=UPI0020B8C6ED|nr:hypothetical protein [Paenibacillus sp. Lou8.1]MCP3808189.1 hypothetical protein [Paenibacillus sp. Lou8.1]
MTDTGTMAMRPADTGESKRRQAPKLREMRVHSRSRTAGHHLRNTGTGGIFLFPQAWPRRPHRRDALQGSLTLLQQIKIKNPLFKSVLILRRAAAERTI